MLAQLSVFEGGFTIDSMEAVVESDVGSPWQVDILQSLTEKSLVRKGEQGRFDLLVSVREYASGHLQQSAESSEKPGSPPTAYARHWYFFSGFDSNAAIRDRCVELDNLTLACRRALVHGDLGAATMALVACWEALRICGPFRAAVDLAETVGQRADLDPGNRAKVEWVAGSALYTLGRVSEARLRYETGIELARLVGDTRAEAQLLCARGELLTTSGFLVEASSDLERALAMAYAQEDKLLQCRALNASGTLFFDQSATDQARSKYHAALALAQEIGSRRWEGGLLGNLGNVSYSEGSFEEAKKHWEQALSAAQDLGDRLWEGNTLCNLGLLCHERGVHQEANSALKAALKTAREIGHTRLECMSLCNLGITLEAQGLLGDALSHFEASIRLAHELEDRHAEGQFLGYLGLLLAKLGRFSESRKSLEKSAAIFVATLDKANLVLAICNQCECELMAGDVNAATLALSAARTLSEQVPVESRRALLTRLQALGQHDRLR